jgi:MFS family permease
LLLLLAYGLCALGFVPHMLFLASFVAIGLHRGVAAGAATSAVLGFAAAVGPPVLGRLADRFGFLPTLAIGYVVMAASVALPLVTNDGLVLSLSAFGVGAIGLGTVMLTSGALSGLVPANRMAATWGLATVVYGICQAVCAAGFSQLFHVTGSFLLLFAIGAMAAATAGVSVFAAGRTQAHAALT